MTSRAAAGMTVVLAALMVAELGAASAAASYDVVLVGAVVVCLAASALGLWHGSSVAARLAAFFLAAVSLGGQVLVSVVGGPSGAEARWQPIGVVVVATAAGVIALVARIAGDARDGSGTTGPRHPYAL